jgi:hypothetical protein
MTTLVNKGSQMNDSLELINSELQVLANEQVEVQVDLQWERMFSMLKNVNFTLQDLSDEVREDEVSVRWEDMMTEMYWNSRSDYEFDLDYFD